MVNTKEWQIISLDTADSVNPEKIAAVQNSEALYYDEYNQPLDDSGFLKIQTFTAHRAFPLQDSEIELYKVFQDGRQLQRFYKTDQFGSTLSIELPAPQQDLSLTPEAEHPYATYSLTVKHRGFEEVTIKNVDIFAGIVSLQELDLLPLELSAVTINQVEIIGRES
ncbi:MAG: hypothetical protein RR387_04600 [Clostridiales bacterium]